ncbi:MAG: hypothetical protein ACLRSW_14180 [Christensenellaceae bacterium]
MVCKYRFRGGEFIYSMVIVIVMIPVSLPAQYGLYSRLGGGFAADSVGMLFGIQHDFHQYSFLKEFRELCEAALSTAREIAKYSFPSCFPWLCGSSAMGIMGLSACGTII